MRDPSIQTMEFALSLKKEITELRNKNEELEDELHKLRKDVDELKKFINTMHGASDALIPLK